MEAGRELGPADEVYSKSPEKAGLLPAGGFGFVDLIHTSNTETAKQGARRAFAPKIAIRLA
jgi:hypothetical protein